MDREDARQQSGPGPASGVDVQLTFGHAAALHRAGRLAEAEALYRQLVQADPGHFDSQHMLGLACYQRGAHADALHHIDLAVGINSSVAAAHNHRGAALMALGRWNEALASYGNAIAIDPGDVGAHYNRANLLKELGRFAEALVDYDRGLALAPGNADLLNSRGMVLRALKRFNDAVASYDRALAVDPHRADVHCNRGNALIELNRIEDALATANRAIAIDPQLPQAFNLRGNALQDMRLFADALASYDRAIAIKPDYAEALWNRGMCRLLVGRWAEGWADYEWRWKIDRGARGGRTFPQPQWDGRADLAGKTILLHAEQGYGDTLMAVRYVRQVIARGAAVVLEVPAPLRELLAEFGGAAQVVTQGHPLPAFELHCPLMSLPLAFQTTVATIPSDSPYLSVPRAQAEQWRQRLPKTGRPRIGLSWGGRLEFPRDRERSIGLRPLLPILARTDAQFVSIQRDLRDGDAEILRAHPEVTHLGDAIQTFADTAAIMAELDLIISSDTSVVHLAGALGRPVWILLAYVPDWRWLLDRTDCPWYPSARLFRQTQRSNWSRVVKDVEQALTGFWSGAAPARQSGWGDGDAPPHPHVCKR